MNRLFALIFILFTGSLISEAKSKEYVIGVEDINYFPLFNFSSTSLTNPSFTRDLLVKFFETHQLNYRFVALPVKRFDRWFIEQDIDFKFPDNHRWRINSREKLNIIYSDPVLELEAGTYVLKNNQNFQRKQIKKLSTILGFYPTLWLNEVKNKQIVLQEETAPMGIVKHVLHGNADATNIDSNVIRNHLKLIGKEDEIVLASNITHEKYHYHFSSIKHPEIIKLFNQFLTDEHEFIVNLKNKYHIVE